jgi:hypothetical protein
MKDDTHPLIKEEMAKRRAKLTPLQMMEQCAALHQAGRILAERLAKERNPSLTGVDLEMAVFRLLYQRSLSPELLDDIERHLRGVRQRS